MSAEPEYLPASHLTLEDARRKLTGLHFAKEALSPLERETLAVAEALLRHVDQLEAQRARLDGRAGPWRDDDDRAKAAGLGKIGL